MNNPLRRTLLLLAGLALLGACRDGGSPTGAAPAGDEARVGFSLNVAGTSVTTIAVEVTAPDITSRLVFNIDVVNGVATGSITIPAGADRTITARAYDAKGVLTHQGSKVVTVKGGANTSITITMVPTAGEQPLTISFGALVVQVSRVAPPLDPGIPNPEIGDTVRYRAVIQNADGTPVSGKVRWASSNPSIATVDSLGLVTARRPGQVEVAATYQGAGGAATITVRGDGTDGSADQTAPRITGFTFSAGSVDLAAGDTVLNITVSATDAGVGVSHLYLYLYAPAVGDATLNPQEQFCSAMAPPGPSNTVSWTCRIKFSPHNAAGTWTLLNIQIRDKAGNHRSVTESDLAARGIKTTVEVANANADLTAPAATGISIAPDSINLTTASDTTVTVTVTAADPGAGVESLSVSFRNPASAFRRSCIADHYSLPSGTATNQVTWSCRVVLPRTSEAGTYTVSSVYLHDRVGNERGMTLEQVAATGGETSFKVVK